MDECKRCVVTQRESKEEKKKKKGAEKWGSEYFSFHFV